MKSEWQKSLTIIMLAMMVNIVVALPRDQLAIKQDYPLSRLSKNVYVIYGPNEEVSKQNQAFRNNPVIVLTNKGVVVIDPGSSVYTGEMVVKKVKALTNQPIVAVFNTHVHGDHWLGNHGIQNFYPGVTIYGHQKMIDGIKSGDGDMWIKAINNRSEGAIEGTKIVAPNKAVKDGELIKMGNVTFRVIYSGKTHSDSDIMLEIVEDKIFFFGDVLRVENLSPFMSSFSGNLKALDMAEKRNANLYVPGHGPSGGKELINHHRRFITILKKEVKKYYDEGLSDFEMKPKVIKALGEYKSWSGFDENIGRLINLAYLEVESESF